MKTHYFFNVWIFTILGAPVLFLLSVVPLNTETKTVFLLIGALFAIWISSLIFALPAMGAYALILKKVGCSKCSKIGAWRRKGILML